MNAIRNQRIPGNDVRWGGSGCRNVRDVAAAGDGRASGERVDIFVALDPSRNESPEVRTKRQS